MNITSIINFNKTEDNHIITVPKGQSIYQGHIILKYPSYKGPKINMFSFYQKELKHYTKPQLNDILHTLINSIQY